MRLLSKVAYLASGFTNRVGRPKKCPACGSTTARVVDRKGLHTLNECDQCALRYRYPAETAQQMERFYQSAYEQKGLTTDLPIADELKSLMANRFRGTIRDVSYILRILDLLDIKPGQAVLDFGASWGYYTWQLQQAGYRAEGYEISKPRAHYAQNLGVEIKTSLDDVSPPFDAVFSSHVLEHLPNPLESLQQMAKLTRPGGYVIAVTPNGSPEFQQRDPQNYHRIWGFVHPVLITAKFFQGVNCFSNVRTLALDRFEPDQFESSTALENTSLVGGTILLIGRTHNA